MIPVSTRVAVSTLGLAVLAGPALAHILPRVTGVKRAARAHILNRPLRHCQDFQGRSQ